MGCRSVVEKLVSVLVAAWLTCGAFAQSVPLPTGFAVNVTIDHNNGAYVEGFNPSAHRLVNPQVRYLSPTGSNNNTGLTAQSPWQTFSKAVAAVGATPTRFVCTSGQYQNVASWPQEYEIVCSDGGYAELTTLQHVIPSGAKCYFYGVRFATLVNSPNGGERFFEVCDFDYKLGDCTAFDGGTVIVRSCSISGGVGDGLDYRGVHSPIHVYEAYCSLTDLGDDAADNCSTGHGECKIVRFGGSYTNAFRPVHDVDQCEVVMVENVVHTTKSISASPSDSFLVGAGHPASSGGEAVTTTIYGGDIFGGAAVADLFAHGPGSVIHVASDTQYNTSFGNVQPFTWPGGGGGPTTPPTDPPTDPPGDDDGDDSGGNRSDPETQGTVPGIIVGAIKSNEPGLSTIAETWTKWFYLTRGYQYPAAVKYRDITNNGPERYAYNTRVTGSQDQAWVETDLATYRALINDLDGDGSPDGPFVEYEVNDYITGGGLDGAPGYGSVIGAFRDVPSNVALNRLDNGEMFPVNGFLLPPPNDPVAPGLAGFCDSFTASDEWLGPDFSAQISEALSDFEGAEFGGEGELPSSPEWTFTIGAQTHVVSIPWTVEQGSAADGVRVAFRSLVLIVFGWWAVGKSVQVVRQY